MSKQTNQPKTRTVTISKRNARKLLTGPAAPPVAPPVIETAPETTTAIEPVSPAVAIATPSGISERSDARRAAAKAVATFYAGVSLPFKSAYDLKRKAAINFALTRDPSARSAALIAAILTYCDVQPGTLEFVRGSGRVPGRLLGLTGNDAEHLFPAGPESGGLSNCIPDRIAYLSGPLHGAGCETATFRINYDAARNNLLAFNTKQADGEHLFSGPIALLDLLREPAHAMPAATDSE